MQLRGPLMTEHRLIERMVALMRGHLKRAVDEGHADPAFIEKAIDFMHVYADRCHHGKEEDILFRELSRRDLSPAHRGMLATLQEEHQFARRTSKALLEATRRYAAGEKSSLAAMISGLQSLVAMYPKHIITEDEDFFPPVMSYFTEREQDEMLEEFEEFDRQAIHEVYRAVVEDLQVQETA